MFMFVKLHNFSSVNRRKEKFDRWKGFLKEKVFNFVKMLQMVLILLLMLWFHMILYDRKAMIFEDECKGLNGYQENSLKIILLNLLLVTFQKQTLLNF